MGYKNIMLVISLLVVILIPGTGAGQSQKEAPAKTLEGKILSPSEPNLDFHEGRESFLKKDLKASAEAIRKGAAYLASEASRATEKGKQTITASMDELEKLADRVEKGEVKSVKELDRSFSRADHALAQYHYLKATEAWTKQETARAGQELKAAAPIWPMGSSGQEEK